MNYLDIAILGIMGGFLLKGVMRGLLKEICSLCGLFAGAFLAFRYHPPLARMAMENFGLPPMLCVVGAFLVLFLCTVLFFVLLGYLLSRFVKLLFLGGLNRVAGGIFGLVQGILLLAVILFAVSLRPAPEMVRPALNDSQLAPPFVHLGESVFNGGRRLFAERK